MHPRFWTTCLLLCCLCAFLHTASGEDFTTQKRIVPPTVYLHFPDSIQVSTFYIYPDCIAFQPLKGLDPNEPLIAEISNLHERPHYERTIKCTYLADDDTFWLQIPEDVPSEVSIGFKKERAAEQDAAANP